jgi:[ribosomal protein S5]-alanine N-acetyltransferase
MGSTLHEPYFLKSERLGFRCWSKDDLPLARELWGDIGVTRFFGGPFSDEEIRQRLEREITRMNAYQFQYWPIHLLSDNGHVWCCGLRPYRLEDDVHELGFHLRPKYWGRGLAPEAARAVIDFAFETIGAKSLSAGHHPQNVASKKVLEKPGFQYSHHEFFATLGMDIPYYMLTRPSRAFRENKADMERASGKESQTTN